MAQLRVAALVGKRGCDSLGVIREQAILLADV